MVKTCATMKNKKAFSIKNTVSERMIVMKEIVIVRHGQTLFNLLNRTQGWADSPLTEVGRQQARDMGMALRASDLWIDLVISSDRGRAIETGRLILETAGLDLELQESSDWRELSFGSLEGMPNDENIKRMLEQGGYGSTLDAIENRRQFREFITDTVVLVDESGWAESRQDFEERLLTALSQTIEKLEEVDGQRALVIAHGVVMETLLIMLTEGEMPEIENGRAMILVEENGRFRVKGVNLSQF